MVHHALDQLLISPSELLAITGYPLPPPNGESQPQLARFNTRSIFKYLGLQTTTTLRRFSNFPEFLVPFLLASCIVKCMELHEKPKWVQARPIYITHSILGLLTQAQITRNNRPMMFLNFLARSLLTIPSDTMPFSSPALWTETSVCYRLSSPFVSHDYIGRAGNWFNRYQQHRRALKSGSDSLPCYSFINKHNNFLWFSIPFIRSKHVKTLEPQFITRFAPKLNSTFNRWAKYSNSYHYTDLRKRPSQQQTVPRCTRRARARENSCLISQQEIRTSTSTNTHTYFNTTAPVHRNSPKIDPSLDLCDTLKAIRSTRADKIRITCDRGRSDITDYMYLARCYGQSIITNSNLPSFDRASPPTLASLIPDIRSLSTIQPLSPITVPQIPAPWFTISVRYDPQHQQYDKTLHDIAIKNRSGINVLRTSPISTLIKLQLHALNADIKPTQCLKAHRLIKECLRTNHRRYVSAYPSLKIPNSSIKNTDLRELMHTTITSITQHADVQQILLKNSRIIYTKHRTIADFFHNHGTFARSSATDIPATCCCAQYPSLPRSFVTNPSTHKHIGLKITDLPLTHPLSTLQQCSKNVPVPATKYQFSSFLLSFRDFLHGMIDSRSACSTCAVPTHQATLSFIKQDCRSMDTPTATSATLEFLFHTVSCISMSDKASITAQAVSICTTITPVTSPVGPASTYSSLAHTYPGLIFSPLDKNTGSTFVCCPCVYQSKLEKAFISNSGYDSSISDPDTPALRDDHFLASSPHLSAMFHNHVEQDPANYSTPTSYLLPKNKNILKDRPIVSYSRHRLKKIYNVCARALLFALNQKEIHQYTLWKTHDLLPFLNNVNTAYSTLTKKKTLRRPVIVSENGDISQMYTALDHTSILNSVQWLLDTHMCRRKGITIPKDQFDKPYFSNCTTSPSTHFWLSKSDILAIVSHDLNNIFFTSRTKLLRQTAGIAMGSPLSPALAILNCAFFENKFHSLIKKRYSSLSTKFFSVRYMDDLLSFVIDQPRLPNSTQIDTSAPNMICATHADSSCETLHPIIFDLFHFYHHRLTMEIEPHSGTFKFLESTIQIRPTRTVSQFYLKNYDSAQRAVVRKFLHTQHWDSFNNSNLKSALITGTLCRIARYTTPPVCDLHTAGPPTQGLDLLSPVVAHWARELRSFGTPKTAILRALRRISPIILPPFSSCLAASAIHLAFTDSPLPPLLSP